MFALLRVLQSRFVGALGGAHRKRSDGNAAAIQDAQTIDESLALLAEQLRFRQPAIRKNNFTGGASAHSKFVFFLADVKTRNAGLQNESGNAVMRRSAVGHPHCNADVGILGIGGKRF